MSAAQSMYLIVVCRPFPAAPLIVRRRYLIMRLSCCPRRRSWCVAVTLSCCPGRCPRRRSLCIAGT
jgi:hypothetical protein